MYLMRIGLFTFKAAARLDQASAYEEGDMALQGDRNRNG